VSSRTCWQIIFTTTDGSDHSCDFIFIENWSAKQDKMNADRQKQQVSQNNSKTLITKGRYFGVILVDF
jgi:hypothetical protein